MTAHKSLQFDLPLLRGRPGFGYGAGDAEWEIMVSLCVIGWLNVGIINRPSGNGLYMVMWGMVYDCYDYPH